MPFIIRITMTGQQVFGKGIDPVNIEAIRLEATGHSYEDAVEAAIKKLKERTRV